MEHSYVAHGTKDKHLQRLKRIEGQVRGLHRMVDEEQYCIDILTQVSAVTRALQSLSLALLDEPVQEGLIAGAVLIVVGGILLVGERTRPEHVKRVGLLLALLATVVFAVRDNFVRWLAVETDAAPPGAAAADSVALVPARREASTVLCVLSAAG